MGRYQTDDKEDDEPERWESHGTFLGSTDQRPCACGNSPAEHAMAPIRVTAILGEVCGAGYTRRESSREVPWQEVEKLCWRHQAL